MSDFFTIVTETLKSPTTWAIWMFISSSILLFFLTGFIDKISKGILIGTIVGLFLYGVYIINSTKEFNQLSVYIIIVSIIAIIILSGILLVLMKYLILGILIGLIAFGSYTIVQSGNDSHSIKAQEFIEKTVPDEVEKSVENNWKKFIF